MVCGSDTIVHASYANHEWFLVVAAVIPKPLNEYNAANRGWIVPLGFVFCFAWGLELCVTTVLCALSYSYRRVISYRITHLEGKGHLLAWKLRYGGYHVVISVDDAHSCTTVSRAGILVVSSASTSSKSRVVRELGVSYVVYG